ncbi:unnamed protein product, partial [Mesorhabditis spiculigera]
MLLYSPTHIALAAFKYALDAQARAVELTREFLQRISGVDETHHGKEYESHLPRETPLPTVSSPPLLTINSAQDDFAHFGQYVAVILRKMAGEGNRLEALKLQKKISDLIFESQFDMCQEK